MLLNFCSTIRDQLSAHVPSRVRAARGVAQPCRDQLSAAGLAVLLDHIGINSPPRISVASPCASRYPCLRSVARLIGIKSLRRYRRIFISHGVARPSLGSTFRLRAAAVLLNRKLDQPSATCCTGSVAQPQGINSLPSTAWPDLRPTGAPRLGGLSMDRSPRVAVRSKLRGDRRPGPCGVAQPFRWDQLSAFAAAVLPYLSGSTFCDAAYVA